ncbi:MAG: aminotransferase class I/II-fold pyridoxal phosphate-dependent enzyme [Clostridia bacterium]|nr:aminotransferase class I/II-fold pyridoxal phosphate-dependent enzyme [Clostridia bacterium]
MDTPIYDFVKNYIDKKSHRLHMPGHKGVSFLGCEHLDLTEIDGADYLYNAKGIIRESMDNATQIFGSYRTFYTTEGSSLSIKVMLKTVIHEFSKEGETPLVIASRNAHKAFIYSAMMLNFDVEYVKSSKDFTLCNGVVSPEDLEDAINSADRKPVCVYITSPDYLGGMCDITALSKVCDRYGIPLLVDNAHGGYLNFLQNSPHPIHCGAFMCCDSAHKTLPVLTGGGYLHLSERAKDIAPSIGRFMEFFGSTSPSYLILQSLDLANKYLAGDYSKDLKKCVSDIQNLKAKLIYNGWEIYPSDPLKLTVKPKSFGYSGYDIAEILAKNNGFVEYADPDFVVIMLTPQNSYDDFEFIEKTLNSLPKKEEILPTKLPKLNFEKVLSPFEASKNEFETVAVKDSIGRIASSPNVGFPPAIAVVTAGERISAEAVEIMEYYGIDKIDVIKEHRCK